MPRRSILRLVQRANIVSPPGRLHEENEVMIGNRNILQPRPPLVRIPGMCLQYGFYLLDGLRVLLLKHLIRDGNREHVTGNVPGGSGKGQCSEYENAEKCD